MSSRRNGRMRPGAECWVRERSAIGADGRRQWDRLAFPKSQFRTLSQAWQESDRLDELDGTMVATGRRVRFGDRLQVELRDRVSCNRKSTRLTRASEARHLERELGALWCHEIDVATLQKLVADLHTRGLGRGSVYQLVAFARRILASAKADGIAVRVIPPKALTFPKGSRPRAELRIPTSDEVGRILEATPWPHRAAYALMALAGLRSGEAYGLRWVDVDFARSRLRIRQQAAHGEIAAVKSASSGSEIPMSAPLATVLTEFRSVWIPNELDLVIANARTGRPLTTRGARSRFSRLCSRLGIVAPGLHAFRRYVATTAFQAGLGPVAVKALMRHSSYATTLQYARASIDDVIRGADAVAASVRLPQPVARCGESERATPANPE